MLEGWKEIGDVYPKLNDGCEILTSEGKFYYNCIYDEDDDGGFFEVVQISKTIPANQVTHLKIKPLVK